MPEPKPYKATLMDRHGGEVVQYLRALAYGFISFALLMTALIAKAGWQWWTFPAAIAGGVFAGAWPIMLAKGAGKTYEHVMMSGASTPYVEQYSYQQALVMQGRLDEALESFEAVIAEKPDAIDPRVKAAELYDRDRKNHVRAAELFHEVLRIESITTGQHVYATNRLVDLYLGPLADPGKAMRELRRLIDRYPAAPAASQARDALAALKARHVTSD